MFDLGLAWRKERIARLGFLVGRDKSADEIATELETSSSSVCQQADRLGLLFRDVPNEIAVTLSPRAGKVLWVRNCTAAELVKRILEICATEPHLLENILDEDV